MQAASVSCSQVSDYARDLLQEDIFHPVLAIHLFFQLGLQHMCCSKVDVGCPALPSCLTDSTTACSAVFRVGIRFGPSYGAAAAAACTCPTNSVVNRTRVRHHKCLWGACCARANQLLVPILVCISIHRTGS